MQSGRNVRYRTEPIVETPPLFAAPHHHQRRRRHRQRRQRHLCAWAGVAVVVSTKLHTPTPLPISDPRQGYGPGAPPRPPSHELRKLSPSQVRFPTWCHLVLQKRVRLVCTATGVNPPRDVAPTPDRLTTPSLPNGSDAQKTRLRSRH